MTIHPKAAKGALPKPKPPAARCGAKNRAGGRCGQPRGWGTDHPRRGRCKFHGGNTPNGRKYAGLETARAVLADLAVPVTGNPLQVLQGVLDSAHGVMDAARRMLRELPKADEVTDEKTWALVKLYRESIEAAGRMAKMAAEAVNEDALVKLDMRTGEIIHRILVAALDAYEAAGVGVTGRRAAEETIIRELVAVGPSSDERN